MVTREEIKGHWNELKGKLQQRWGELTDNDLQQFNGNVNQLIGTIERKTGAERRVIEDYLEELIGTGVASLEQVGDAVKGYAEQARDLAGQAKQTVQQYASSASESMRKGYDQVSEKVQVGYEEAASVVRRSPMESLAVSFGVGIITGVVVSLALRRR